MSMTRHLRNERCPSCAKRGRDRHGDNLGVYDDGSVFCYSCGYSKSGHSVPTNWRANGNTAETTIPSVVLPSDVDTYIPAVARSWLGQYGLTEYELINNKLLWSESWQQLIFPYFDKWNNLCAWQGRNFKLTSDNGRSRPKWFSQGNLTKLYHILPINETYTHDLVLVEDVVSAIKLSRYANAMPVFTSRIGLERFKTIAARFTGVVIWLDPDMKKQMATEAHNAKLFGLNVRVVFSTRDPKEHSPLEIEEYLHDST